MWYWKPMNPLLLSNKDEYLLKRLATTQIIDKNVPKSKKKKFHSLSFLAHTIKYLMQKNKALKLQSNKDLCIMK